MLGFSVMNSSTDESPQFLSHSQANHHGWRGDQFRLAENLVSQSQIAWSAAWHHLEACD